MERACGGLQENNTYDSRHGDATVDEGPALIGCIFRQQVAENEGKSQIFSPRIYVRSESASHRSLQYAPSLDPRCGPGTSPREATSQHSSVADSQVDPSLPQLKVHNLSTQEQASYQCVPSPSVWRDNVVFNDNDGNLGFEMDLKHVSNSAQGLRIETVDSLQNQFWESPYTTPQPHPVNVSPNVGWDIPLHQPISWMLCLAFEEVLPHPSRGLLSRMLRLTNVRSTTVENSQEPLLHLRPSTDYLLTCFVRPYPPNGPLPDALQLRLGTTDHEIPVDMEQGGPKDSRVWSATGCWRSPEIAETDSCKPARMRGRVIMTSFDCSGSKGTLRGESQWDFQVNFNRQELFSYELYITEYALMR